MFSQMKWKPLGLRTVCSHQMVDHVPRVTVSTLQLVVLFNTSKQILGNAGD